MHDLRCGSQTYRISSGHHYIMWASSKALPCRLQMRRTRYVLGGKVLIRGDSGTICNKTDPSIKELRLRTSCHMIYHPRSKFFLIFCRYYCLSANILSYSMALLTELWWNLGWQTIWFDQISVLLLYLHTQLCHLHFHVWEITARGQYLAQGTYAPNCQARLIQDTTTGGHCSTTDSGEFMVCVNW